MLIPQIIKLDETPRWDDLINHSITASFFQTRDWLTLWMKHFGPSTSLRVKRNITILGIYADSELIGIAPLYESDEKITFLGVGEVLGGELVSDFGDIIAIKGREREVWETVLKERNNGRIEFDFIREDSPSFGILKELGGKTEEIDMAPYIDLPKSWDEYLVTLDRHDRHELRRKMRKLEGEGAFQICPEPDGDSIEEFFRLMQLGNEQKRNFLSEKMRDFFRDIFATFAPKKLLQLCFLKTGDKIIAATLSFMFKDEVLLYNSGFDPDYSYLAPGILLKAYMIKQSVKEGKKRFDFLQGGERYKYDLGGKERKLYKITLD